jgi:hypothetical protein
VPNTSRTFDHSLYPSIALNQTATAYSELMSVSLETTDTSTVAQFDVSGEDAAMLIDAFSNHALFLSIQVFREQGQI